MTRAHAYEHDTIIENPLGLIDTKQIIARDTPSFIREHT